jgi:DNA-binding transcriptional ArsR family regulator
MPSTPTPENDSTRWRAYTHPVRVAILQLLEDERPRRVTDIAEAIGAPVNSTSFHLRTLARYGLIEPVEDALAGDRRSSTWRHTGMSVGIPDVSDDETALVQATAAARQYEQAILTRTSSWFAQATSPDSDAETFNFDQSFHLSETDAEDLRDRLRGLLEEIAQRSDPSAPRVVRLWGFGLDASRGEPT